MIYENYERFIEEYLNKGLLKRQKSNYRTPEALILRALKDLKTSKANLDIDEGTAYAIAYLAMLRAGRAFMILKGLRPANGYQHKTVVEFMAYFLGKKFESLVEHFDRMRKKRNIFTYDVGISISKTEAKNALNTAAEFVNVIRDVIRRENPQIQFKF